MEHFNVDDMKPYEVMSHLKIYVNKVCRYRVCMMYFYTKYFAQKPVEFPIRSEQLPEELYSTQIYSNQSLVSQFLLDP